MESVVKKTVLDADGITLTLQTMTDDIQASQAAQPELALVGIRTGGVYLAQRLKYALEKQTSSTVPLGVIDITLYRDDWTRIAQKPIVGRTELNFSIDEKRIILVDDVLFTGRTVRAALDALTDFGRPARIELAVLVDRGHRELPICANFTGLTVETSLDERVNVYFTEQGHTDEVALEKAS